MDILTFISNLVRDLAWPTAALIGLFVAIGRGPNLVRFVKAIRYKDFEVTIRENFDEARAEAQRIQVAASDAPTSDLVLPDKVLRLAEIDPALAVVDVWKKLEAEIIKLIQHNGMMRFTNAEKFVEELGRFGKLSKNEVQLFQKLRLIRNQSVHSHWGSTTLTLAEVVEFRDFAEILTKRLEQIRSEPGYITVPSNRS